MACQMPFRSGWPSAARGARYACPCPAAGVEFRANVAATAAPATAARTPRILYRILTDASRRTEYTGINSKVKEMQEYTRLPGRAAAGSVLCLIALVYGCDAGHGFV